MYFALIDALYIEIITGLYDSRLLMPSGLSFHKRTPPISNCLGFAFWVLLTGGLTVHKFFMQLLYFMCLIMYHASGRLINLRTKTACDS